MSVRKAFNHIGISVKQLDAAIAFYRDAFDMEFLCEPTDFRGEQYAEILGLEGACGRVATLRSGTLQLELFEFHHPSPSATISRKPVSDHGISHFCVAVDDIDAMYLRLSRAGASFHCAPLTFEGGFRATYGRDPDGNVFELLQIPKDGKFA